MHLTYSNSIKPKINNKAISFCLFNSDKFYYDKHIIPFEDFLAKKECIEYDILIFYRNESELTNSMKESINYNIRLFKVTSDEVNYACHLWRYLGANEDYDWVWFRGLDTPSIPSREKALERCASTIYSEIIIWSRKDFDCMGKLAVHRNQKYNLVNFLRNSNIDNLHNDWNCDERLLSRWVSTGNQRVMLAMDKSSVLHSWQEDWILKRLREGNHTVIVKDRDDRIVK